MEPGVVARSAASMPRASGPRRGRPRRPTSAPSVLAPQPHAAVRHRQPVGHGRPRHEVRDRRETAGRGRSSSSVDAPAEDRRPATRPFERTLRGDRAAEGRRYRSSGTGHSAPPGPPCAPSLLAGNLDPLALLALSSTRRRRAACGRRCACRAGTPARLPGSPGNRPSR